MSNYKYEEVIIINAKCVVRQRLVNDCGIACLTSILKSFGIKASYDSVKSKIKLKETGVSAYEIIRVAKLYNLNAAGYKNCTLNKNMSFPFIALTINNNIQHFVVVLKILDNKISIMDPAKGLILVSKKDFNKIYTGITIMFKKNNDLFIKKEVFNKKFILLITCIILFLAFINIVYSYALSYTVENFNTNKIVNILIILLLIGVLKELINYVKERMLLKYHILIDRAITIPTLKKIINLPHDFYQKASSGELMSKINDLSYIKEMIYVVIEILFVNIIIIFISLIFMLFINKYIFMLNLFVIIFFLFYTSSFYKKNSFKNYDLQMKNENLNVNISNAINSITSIKNLCKEKYFENRIINSYKKAIKSYNDLSTVYQNKNLFLNMFIFVGLVMSFILLINDNNHQVLFITYLQTTIYESVIMICNLTSMYADFNGAYVRINEIYKQKQIDNDGLAINVNSISFKDTFYKKDKKTIFKNINFDIKKGDFIMINGPTGSGKSSLFKMLTMQIKNNGKNIFINDKCINTYSKGQIRKSITYVDQKIKLFNDTIKENILMGSKIKLRNNFKKTLDSFLNDKKLTYDTVIDNTDSNLSGGEKSVIVVAQTLNNGGNVIIFDETTSQMDICLERKILKAIKDDYKDKTIILVSHRLSNKDLFDKVINFSDNKENKRRKNEEVKAK